MEKQISDRSLVDLLFKTIKEFYLKSENIVSDCKKYDRCRLISTLLSLDEKHEYIKIFCDDEKEEYYLYRNRCSFLSVQNLPHQFLRG